MMNVMPPLNGKVMLRLVVEKKNTIKNNNYIYHYQNTKAECRHV